MTILIILIILIAIGIVLIKKYYYCYNDIDIVGIIMCLVFGSYLIIHIAFWSTASYNYNVAVVKRAAFISTLDYARKNNNPIEIAAITKEISDFNQDLAESQYNATVFIIKDYTDERMLTLQPIH